MISKQKAIKLICLIQSFIFFFIFFYIIKGHDEGDSGLHAVPVSSALEVVVF